MEKVFTLFVLFKLFYIILLFQNWRGAGSKYYGQAVCEFWIRNTQEGAREGVNWSWRSVSGNYVHWYKWLVIFEPHTLTGQNNMFCDEST